MKPYGVLAASTSGFREPLETALPKIAALGFRAVDLLAIGGWPHIDLDRLTDDFAAEADRLERLLAASGLTPVALNCAFPPNASQREDAAANGRRRAMAAAAAQLMRRLGVAVASFYPGYLREEVPAEERFERSVATFREIVAAGTAAGVRFVVEPHWQTPFQDPAEIRRLLAALPGLEIAYDPSHFLRLGVPLAETEWLLAHARSVHLRDADRARLHAPFGTGELDVGWLLGALRRRRFQGVLSIECLPSPEGDATADYRALKAVVEAVAG